MASAYKLRQFLDRYHSLDSDKQSKAFPRGPASPFDHLDIPLLTNQRAFQPESERKTILYLAYGSNLAAETFRGRRGIKPLSQVNVVVPELRMTFDLPGIPYTEPCFANTAKRDPYSVPAASTYPTDGSMLIDKISILPLHHPANSADYHKNRWKKGLVGVVYEVTPADYAHIIATEGGGASYHDILVQCHPLDQDVSTVPLHPDNKPFAAHTLFAPASPSDAVLRHDGRLQRPDTSYAQPSARYLGLITSGAEECKLPNEYRSYLNSIRSYTITTLRQRLGQFLLTAFWSPILMFLFAVLLPMFSDDEGRAPDWLMKLADAIFTAVWATYDNFFRVLFGDGERTVSAETPLSALPPVVKIEADVFLN